MKCVMCSCGVFVIGVSTGLASAGGGGEVASALIREGDNMAEFGQVSSVSDRVVNHAGGYAILVETRIGNQFTSLIWGSYDGGPGEILWVESTVRDVTQTFIHDIALGDDEVIYVASSNFGLTLWRGQDLIAMEGEVAVPGFTYDSFGVRALADGTPYWRSRLESTDGQAPSLGWFFGDGATPIMLAGDVVPDLPFPVARDTANLQWSLSSAGSSSLARVQMDTGSEHDDGTLVRDGAGLVIGGALIREDELLPAALGGEPGDRWWGLYSSAGVAESGDWFFAGCVTSCGEGLIVKNGTIRYREGDIVDGHELVVLSDNRTVSTEDSRELGPLPMGEMWRVAVRYWPPARIGPVR